MNQQCLYKDYGDQNQGRRHLWKNGTTLKRQSRLTSAEGKRGGEHERGIAPSRKGLRFWCVIPILHRGSQNHALFSCVN